MQLNSNTTSIPTTGGNDTLGHLVLTIGRTDYQNLSLNNVYHPPPEAPPDAPNFQPNSTGAQISETRRLFDNQGLIFKLYYTTDAVLKQQLLASVDEKYVKIHKNRNTSYARVTNCSLIEHLLTTYRRITPDNLIKNEEQMKSK